MTSSKFQMARPKYWKESGNANQIQTGVQNGWSYMWTAKNIQVPIKGQGQRNEIQFELPIKNDWFFQNLGRGHLQ